MVVFDAAQTRRAGPDPRPPAAAHRRDRDAAGRQPARRGRAGAAAPHGVDHGDLRQGRPRRTCGAGSALAGRPVRRCVVTGPLREGLADYLALRRALGYRLDRPEKLLGQFLDHLEQAGAATITIADGAGLGAAARRRQRRAGGPTGSRWCAASPPTCTPWTPRTRCRPRTCCRSGRTGPSPYLYSDADIAALIAAAGSLRSPLRRATFATLIGLLAVTGMRVGEAIGLDRDDIDLTPGGWWCGTASSASPASWPCTRPPSRRCAATSGSATDCPGDRHIGVVRLHGRDPAALLQRPPDLPPPGRPGRAQPAVGVVPSADSRPAPHLRRRHDARRLRRRPGRADPADAVVDLPRARRTRPTPTGICRPPRSCWPWPGSVSKLTSQPGSRPAMSALAPTLQAFFTDRLIRQRHASPPHHRRLPRHLRLLLGFAADAHRHAHRPTLDIADLDAPLIAGVPGPPRTRARQQRPHPQRPPGRDPLAVPLRRARHPEHAASIARVLAIPPKRFDRALISYLTEPEVDALLGLLRPDHLDRRRDHALLLLAVQTGLRVSELIGLTRADVHLGTGAHVSCHGKGRKDRITPLTTDTRSPCCGTGSPNTAAAPTSRCSPPAAARPLSRDAIEHRLAHYAVQAADHLPVAARQERSPRTSCGTPPRCGCCTPASTPPSSPSGSATSASRRHRSTSTPTSRSKSKRWPEPDHPTASTGRYQPPDTPPRLARSALIMPTSPARNPLPCNGISGHIGIIRRSA